MSKKHRLDFELGDKRVAVLATHGFEQSELMTPVEVLQDAGVSVDVITPDGRPIRGWDDESWGQTIAADVSLDDARPGDYDGLLLPGGVLNSDALRVIQEAGEFARHFIDNGKPTFAICHAAQILIDAELVSGRKMTSAPAIAQDLRNAGAIWQDSEVVVDNGLVSSRSPDDLPAFATRCARSWRKESTPDFLRTAA